MEISPKTFSVILGVVYILYMYVRNIQMNSINPKRTSNDH